MRVSNIHVIITFCFCALIVHAQTINVPLSLFQKFVNGEVAVKEAIVYRTLSDTNGKIINREWWRFGCQNDGTTWYVQRLTPDAPNSTNLAPKSPYSVYGASFSQLWLVGDQNIQSVDKNVASGSLPDKNNFHRSLLFDALSLGLPRKMDALAIQESPVKFDNLLFKLALDSNGLPVSAECLATDSVASNTITYEYKPNDKGLPTTYTQRFHDETVRYQFLKLDLGSNDLAQTGGYLPSMFTDTNAKPGTFLGTFVWTNDFCYMLVNGRVERAFAKPPPKLGEPAPELRGTNWLNSPPLKLADLHGKVVFLDFWSQSCAPCVAGLPHVQELYNKYKNQGLMVIAIYLQGEKNKPLNLFLKDRGLTNLPVMVDIPVKMTHSQPWSTLDLYGTTNRGLPGYALIDKSGKLVWENSLTDESYKESQIEELLKVAPPN